MLVLTRKTDEQILIGDDIKITLVRVRGNSVRIGIDAPREVRVVRGELLSVDSKASEETTFELSDREQVFAHPQAKNVGQRVNADEAPSADPATQKRDPIQQVTEPAKFIGRVRCASKDEVGSRAPLARFVSAT